MVLTDPYKQNHYIGEYASDALALTFIQAELWDSLGTGLGTPQAGMLYHNTDIDRLKFYDGTGWRVLRGDFDFQESVINFFDPTGALPVGPATGDRYISSATANGWTINWIYEFDGVLWMGFQPSEGSTVEVEALDDYYHFNGAAWVLMATIFQHNNLAGIQGGVAGEYYHIALQDQIYFVGKEGSDTNNGLTEGSKFLTFGAAIAAATVQVPGAANIFTIVCSDSGIYNENIVVPSYVNIYAPNASLVGTAAGTLTINSNCTVVYKNMTTDIASAIGVQKPDVDDGTAYIVLERFTNNSAVGIINLGIINAGDLAMHIKRIDINAGIALGSAVANGGHVQVNISDIYLIGNNTTALACLGAGASVTGRISNIFEYGVPVGTTGINVLSGQVDLNINVLTADVAYTVAIGAALNLYVNDLVGTETAPDGSLVSVIKADQLRENMTFQRIFDWLLFNGAISDTLNAGRVTTTRLPQSATDPGIQFKVDLKDFQPTKAIAIEIVAAHSNGGEALDFDLNYVSIAANENFNTEAPSAAVVVTPTAPAAAYDAFTFVFQIPAADVPASGYIECQMSRDTTPGVGDTHVWEVRAFQSP